MHSISAVELELWSKGGLAHTLLDVRRLPRRKLDGAEIAASQWVDPALWLDWKDQVPRQHPVVVYCAQGHEISQGLAACLRALGADARVLQGGFEAWRSAGHPVQAIGGNSSSSE